MRIQQLEITTARLLRFWWAYLWRAVLVTIGATIVAMMVGAIVGGILGFTMHIGGYGTQEIQAVARPVGMILGGLIGLGSTIIPLKLIVGKRFGDFRLVFVADVEETVQGERVAA